MLTIADHRAAAGIRRVLARYGLELVCGSADERIPGSHWGEPEAGLIGKALHVRPDTPLHSVLHEGCHFVCMPHARRVWVHTDAGGDYAEENAVCYLSILLAGAVPEVGRSRMMQDMDAWGYSFRLGSAEAWFERDAEDARTWLLGFGLIDAQGRPTYRLRHRS